MEANARIPTKRSCSCPMCEQGVFTKEQYVQRIRELCGGEKRATTPAYRQPIIHRNCSSGDSSCSDGSVGGMPNTERDTASREQIFHNFHIASSAPDYFIDEEQPTDLMAFSLMMSEKSADPRILPAVVETIRHLRKTYHQMLVNMRPKSLSFFKNRHDNLDTDIYSSEDFSGYNAGDTNSTGPAEEAAIRSPGSKDKDMWNQIEKRRLFLKPKKKTRNFGLKNAAEDKESVHRNKLINNEKEKEYWRVMSRINFDAYDADKLKENPFALHAAASNGDIERVMILILDGFNVNGLCPGGWPAVEYALRKSRFRCAIFLTEAGANMKDFIVKRLGEYETVLRISRNFMHVVETVL